MAITSTTKALEKVARGFSCHRRIQILQVLDQSEEALPLWQIASACGAAINPIGEHVRRLYVAELISKKTRKREVLHDLTPLGRKVVSFLKSIRPID